MVFGIKDPEQERREREELEKLRRDKEEREKKEREEEEKLKKEWEEKMIKEIENIKTQINNLKNENEIENKKTQINNLKNEIVGLEQRIIQTKISDDPAKDNVLKQGLLKSLDEAYYSLDSAYQMIESNDIGKANNYIDYAQKVINDAYNSLSLNQNKDQSLGMAY